MTEGTTVKTAPPPGAAGLTVGPCPDRPLVNAMTVDVEDYFQVSAFAGRIDRDQWDKMACRVEANTDAVLALFADHAVSATFFVLGWVAQRYPALVRRIAAAGHEIASHGLAHIRVDSQTEAAFRADARQSRVLLEDVAGVAVVGYRAASFSVSARTPWAHTALADAGYRYSSSVFPIRHDHYGIPDAPRFPYRPLPDAAISEIPVTTVAFGNTRLPSAGGGYFRLLPYGVFRRALGRVHSRDGRPGIFYFHPWEIDPGQPRISGLSLRTRFRHYTNLSRMEGKLRRALSDFRWDRMDRVFPEAGGGRA